MHLKKGSSSSSIFEISEKVISLASAGSFNVKNDNFHTFFFAVLIANVEFAGFAPKLTKIHGLDRFHGNGPYCKILTEKEPIRAQGFALDWVCHIIILLIFLRDENLLNYLPHLQHDYLSFALFTPTSSLHCQRGLFAILENSYA